MKSRPSHHQSGRPSFCAKSANKDSSLIPFKPTRYRDEKTPIVGYRYTRLGIRKRASLIPNDWPAIYGRSCGNRGQPTRNQGDHLPPPLIANKDSSSLAHFSRPGIGVVKAPIMGYPYYRLGGAKMAQLIRNDWSAIYGRSWAKRAPPTTNPDDPLSGP